MNGRGARREVLDDARRRHERLTAAVVRWGRAMASGDAAEIATAEASLLEVYREIDRPGRG